MPDRELRQLRARLAEAEAVIAALRRGEVDAVVGEHEVALLRLHKTEKALRESEERFRVLVKATSQAVWETDADGAVVTDSPSWRAYTGQTLEEWLGYGWVNAIHPDDRTYAEKQWREAVAAERNVDAEFRLRSPDGGWRWTNVRAAPIRNPNGTIAKWVGMNIDITEGKHIEDALRESEARLSVVLETLPAGVVIADAQGRIVRDNAATRELWGLPPETGSWEDYGDWVGWWPETGERIKAHEWAMTRALLHGEVTRNELVQNQRFNSDERRYYLNNVAPLRDPEGRITGGVAAMLDVTDRIAAEQALRQLNETLEQRVAERTGMLRLLSDVAAAANQADHFDQAVEYTLRRLGEHSGWCFGQAYLVKEDDRDALVPVRSYHECPPGRFRGFRAASLQARLHRGQGLAGRALAGGSVEWTDDAGHDLAAARAPVAAELGIRCGAAFPILAGDKVVGVVEILSDRPVRRSRRVTESMAAIGTQLGRVVERERFEKRLSRALALEQERTGQDLHDTIGQELAGMALIVDRMAQRAKSGTAPSTAALREVSDGLRHALNEARAVVRGLLPPAVQGEAYPAALHELARTMTERHGLACEVHSDEQVSIDAPDVAMHLYRIAAEAMTNAVKHAHAQRIEVRLGRPDGRLVLEVRDDGVGIPADPRATGSGLWIMRHRAKVIGATLDVRPRPDGGTIVRCTLPADDPDVCAAEPQHTAP
jgi:PAS domain S-box-containing protein